MTGYDYALIADIIRVMEKNQRDFVARHFAERLKRENRHFKSERFLEECCVPLHQEEDDE